MNPIYKLRHKIQMLKDFLQLLSTGPITYWGGGGGGGEGEGRHKYTDKMLRTWSFSI